MARKKRGDMFGIIKSRLTREVIILTAFTEIVWIVFWAPLGMLMKLSLSQWLAWVGYGIPYDFVFAYITSKIIIKFDQTAKNRGWY